MSDGGRCATCQRLLKRRKGEGGGRFALRRYCNDACYKKGSGFSAASRGAVPAEREHVEITRIPERLRPLLADAAREHPYLLRALGER